MNIPKNIGGSEGQGERLPGSGGALASRLFTKIHPTRNQTPKYSGIRRSNQEDKAGAQRCRGTHSGQFPLGADRDLRSGQGRKKGGAHRWDTASEAGTRLRSQVQAVEAGGCGRRPGGRRFAPGEEVGSGCKRKDLRRQTLLMGGR